jgi:MFS transporter, DHA1 family, inner membrane transport protein
LSVEVHEHAVADQPVSPLLVPVLALGVIVNILCSRALSVFLPVVATDLQTSVSLLGQIPALTLLVAGVLALVAGPLADRYGFRRTLVVGLLAVFVSAFATGLSTTFPVLLVVTLIGAVARASVLPTAQAVVVTAIRDEAACGRAMAWITAGLSVAAILGIPLMTTIAGVTNWRVSFFVLGGLALVAAVLLQRTLTETESRTTGSLGIGAFLDSYAPLRRHRPTVLVMVASFAADTGLWCMLTYYASFLVQRHAFSIEDVGWVFLAMGVVALGGVTICGGPLGAAPWPVLFVTRIVCGLGFGAAVLVPAPWQVSLALVLLAAPTLGMADIATTLVLTNISPAGRATTLTLRSAAVCIGMAVGSALGGVLLALGDYAAVGACTIVALLVSAAFVWSAWTESDPTPGPATTP